MNKRRRRSSRRKKNSPLIGILLGLVIINIALLMANVVKSKSSSASILDSLLPSFNINIGRNKDPYNENIASGNIEDNDEFVITDDYIIKRLEEYENLIIVKDSLGQNSIENIPEPINVGELNVDRDKDYILVYHTHGSESFLTEDPDEYYNEDINKNVVATGNVLATVLEAKGHKVDHSPILHDRPSFSQSYSRSLNTINKKKQENSNLKIFFDLHRDGVDKNASYKDKFLETARIDINGVSTATFSLVVGPDTPNYEEVLSFAKYIKAASDALYPGFCTGIIVKPSGKYNLYSSNHAALIEIGSNLVTLEEAKECAKLVGEILSLVLDSIIE